MAGIYIHIPFCRKKCNYCNFFSVAFLRDIADYLEALISEMELQQNYLGNEIVETIYFGGGTPSVLLPGQTEKILNALKKVFPIHHLPEISFECNPDDITERYLKELASLGINRISLGIQSFYDADLLYLGRTHTSKTALKSLETVLNSEIPEIGIDLIYGIPTLSNRNWLNNLKTAVKYQIPHISAYALTVEEKTPLNHFIKKGKTPNPSDVQTAGQFETVMEYLTGQGYEHYEISNFCLPGHRSKHNSSYWNGTSYLGLGASAHSYNGLSRQWNCANLTLYISEIKKGNIPCSKEILTEAEQYNEYVLTRLRTSEGLNLSELRDNFGTGKENELLAKATVFFDTGWLQKSSTSITLTQKGKLFADKITAELFTDS